MTSQKFEETPITGEQESIRSIAAQNTLKQFQSGKNRGELLGDTLLKAEEVLNTESLDPNLDHKTKKTLEDLAQLVGSVNQIEIHKDIGDRVNKIAEETKLALEEIGKPGINAQVKETSQQAILLVQKLRPLLQLLVTSREFRVLIMDSLEIFRRVFRRHENTTVEEAKQQFIEGDNPTDIVQNIGQKSKISFQNDEGELRVDISEDETNTLLDDISRILVILAGRSSYQDGVEILLDLVDIVRDQVRQATQQKQPLQSHANRARVETEELIASFSGGETLDAFLENFRLLVEKVEQDKKSQEFLKELRNFILTTKSPEKVQQQKFKEKTKKLLNEARDLRRDYHYDQQLQDFFDSTEQFLRNIKNDKFVEVLRHHAGLVAEDLSYVDNSGNVQLDMDMIIKLRAVVVPIIADSLKYIPIPRIESNDKNREFWVDNIVLCGYDVLPDHIRVQIETDSDVSIREIETKHSYTKMIITLGQIRTELKDLEFYYKRKNFPEMVDTGRVTLRVGGTHGATLKLTFRVEQTPSDKLPKFKEGSATFDIEKFDINFDKSTIHHNVILPMVSQLFKAQIQHQIESEVEKNFEKLFGNLGEQLSQALSNVNRPLLGGLEQLRKAGKYNAFGQTFEKRQQKLE